MLGTPMIFVRLAGCSVGCALCDTDYRKFRRASAEQILSEIKAFSNCYRWVWITGGEPTDQDVWPLVRMLREVGYFVAVATAGQRECPESYKDDAADWLSVSPHDPSKWIQMQGKELKLVPGLNGYSLDEFGARMKECVPCFGHSFVSPCEGIPATVRACQDWVLSHPGWLMTVQAHKLWNIQ